MGELQFWFHFTGLHVQLQRVRQIQVHLLVTDHKAHWSQSLYSFRCPQRFGLRGITSCYQSAIGLKNTTVQSYLLPD